MWFLKNREKSHSIKNPKGILWVSRNISLSLSWLAKNALLARILRKSSKILRIKAFTLDCLNESCKMFLYNAFLTDIAKDYQIWLRMNKIFRTIRGHSFFHFKKSFCQIPI